jgi:serine/threonine-protein kinase RsbW
MRATSIRLRPDLDDLGRLQRFIRRFCDRHGLDETLHNRVQLACEEWFVNVVKHGFGEGGSGNAAGAAPEAPDIAVRLALTRPDGLTIRLTDNGPPFNPDEHPLPDLSLPAEQRPIGGLGVYLIRTLANSLHYERKDGRNELTLRMTAGGQPDNGSKNGEEPK